MPGHVDGNELALRAVLGQQVSVAAARRLGARLVAAYGKPLERPEGTLTHCFPAAETLAAADPATLPMPRSPRRRADRAGRRAGVGRAVAGSRGRPGPRRGAVAGPARHRAVDGGLHPDARAVRPGRVPARGRRRAQGARPAGRAAGRDGRGAGRWAEAGPRGRGGAGRELAPVAFLRRTSPVGYLSRREEECHDQPVRGAGPDAPRLSHIVSSPIGRLLLTGDGHALTGLWMLDADRHSARVEDG